MPGAVSNGESSLSLKAGLLRSRALQAHAETPRGRLLLARPVGARGATLRGESHDPRGRHARTAAAGKPVSPWVPVETQSLSSHSHGWLEPSLRVR